jgi:hypothetical protein
MDLYEILICRMPQKARSLRAATPRTRSALESSAFDLESGFGPTPRQSNRVSRIDGFLLSTRLLSK